MELGILETIGCEREIRIRKPLLLATKSKVFMHSIHPSLGHMDVATLLDVFLSGSLNLNFLSTFCFPLTEVFQCQGDFFQENSWKTISIIFKPQFPDLLSYTISRDYMKIESFYSWWPDILSYSGVGIDVPLWGFVSHHITFNYLLEMTSLIVWWCETLGHWPTLDIPQPLRAAHRSRTPPNQEAPGENLENTWRKLQAESDKMARWGIFWPWDCNMCNYCNDKFIYH